LRKNFSEEQYSKCFVDPAQELAAIQKQTNWSFSDWPRIRLHALVREQTVYYHVVQDYDMHIAFHILNGKLKDIELIYCEFAENVKFERLEKFEDFSPIESDLLKRRDAMDSNRPILEKP
jgi:hypothetical protein